MCKRDRVNHNKYMSGEHLTAKNGNKHITIILEWEI